MVAADALCSLMQILCDFYNLHLKSGRQDYLSSYPNQTEQKRMIAFFEHYCPEVLTYPDAKSVEREIRSVKEMELTTDNEIGTLGWYEYEKKVSWFFSRDYLSFTDHWRNLRDLVDSLFTHQINLDLLAWFRNDALRWKLPKSVENEGYQLNVVLLDPQGRMRSPSEVQVNDRLQTVPWGAWRVVETYRYNAMRYRLNMGQLFFQLHQATIDLMQLPSALGRCKAGKTPRREACQNVFLHTKQRGKLREWCSETCKKRIHEAEKRRKQKEEKRGR